MTRPDIDALDAAHAAATADWDGPDEVKAQAQLDGGAALASAWPAVRAYIRELEAARDALAAMVAGAGDRVRELETQLCVAQLAVGLAAKSREFTEADVEVATNAYRNIGGGWSPNFVRAILSAVGTVPKEAP